jgi:hypothetical protein
MSNEQVGGGSDRRSQEWPREEVIREAEGQGDETSQHAQANSKAKTWRPSVQSRPPLNVVDRHVDPQPASPISPIAVDEIARAMLGFTAEVTFWLGARRRTTEVVITSLRRGAL